MKNSKLKKMKEAKYNIGDRVYHVTPESNCGFILDASYSLLYEKWTYRVAFSPTESVWCDEHELSFNKSF